MRQLITRLDDDLHEQLKARAAADGRSLNAFVVETLAAAVAGHDRGSVRGRLAREGRLVVPDRPGRVPSRGAALRATRGAGPSASTALDAERRRR